MGNNRGNGDAMYQNLKWDPSPKITWLSTIQIKEFLQNALDLCVAKMKRSEDGEKYKDLPKIDVTVISTQISAEWIPVFIVLPTTVLEAGDSAKSDMLSVFRKDYDDEADLRMLEPITKFFNVFSYNEDDIKDLKSYQSQKNLGIKRKEMIRELIQYMKPRYRTKKYEGHEEPYVMLVADPIKIFRSMMTDPNHEKEKFEPIVFEVKKIRHGEYKYHVRKQYTSDANSKKYGDMFKDLDSYFTRRNS